MQGLLDAIGPWIGTIGPLPLLFIALARGWLMTPASMQKAFESQEARIEEAKKREAEWKAKAEEAMSLVTVLSKQLDIVTELGETSVKLLEAVHGARFNSDRQEQRSTHVIRPGREG